MKKVIVTTTVQPPTEATLRFSMMEDWQLVVVGDMKTPPEAYRKIDCIFLDFYRQEDYDPVLSDLIGPNTIQRRNFGFLWAVNELGAEIVASVDDDNIPYPKWGENLLVGKEQTITEYQTSQPAFDPFNPTNQPHMWHRGFPIHLLPKRNAFECHEVTAHFSVQADFWNGDPDIDAICRMSHPGQVKFNYGHPFPFTGSAWSPFNSQNTFLTADAVRSYFMHLDVGRLDDIVAGYYLQSLGHRVLYGAPSVHQERSGHVTVLDFEKELWGYKHLLALVELLHEDPENLQQFLTPRAWKAFQLYQSLFK